MVEHRCEPPTLGPGPTYSRRLPWTCGVCGRVWLMAVAGALCWWEETRGPSLDPTEAPEGFFVGSNGGSELLPGADAAMDRPIRGMPSKPRPRPVGNTAVALARVETVVKAARPFAHRDSAAGRRLAAALAALDPTEAEDA